MVVRRSRISTCCVTRARCSGWWPRTPRYGGPSTRLTRCDCGASPQARGKVRARMWKLFGGPPAARAAGRDVGAGGVVLDVDSTIVIAHSDKDGAAPTYKHTYGFHPILVTCDNTGELLAIRLRPGNAGANTAADHLDVLSQAIAQVPARHRRQLLIRADSAAATHVVLDWLTAQNTTRRRVQYSIGWSISEAERAAIGALPVSAWSPALNADGETRDGADVAELTGLLPLPGWPAGARVIVRRERPHPGAQLSLFEERDGWRYTAFVTNTQVGALQWLEARHRAHARVERIPTTWPWATQITAAFTRIAAIPAPG